VNTQQTPAPDDEVLRRIRQHLQQPDARRRIQEYMQNARANARVTTSRAADLLALGQQQLRDWDNRGLIKTERLSTVSSGEGKESKGHRQFTLDELDKIAIIKELTDKGNISPGELLAFIDTIWQEELLARQQEEGKPQQRLESSLVSSTINQRIRNAREQLFWRFFATHAVRFALFLLREDKPTGTIGLILPLRKQEGQARITNISDLSLLGESLVGWLNAHRYSHVMLTSPPSFEYATDFRVQPLANTIDGKLQDNTHIVVRRDADPLVLSPEVVETVGALLHPLYENVEQIETCFGLDMYDMIEATPGPEDSSHFPSLILNDLADMIVHFGYFGAEAGSSHGWLFCCILLQRNSHFPVSKRTLVVRAQSKHSPHKVGVSSVPPDLNSLSLHAFQSGLVCYRDKLSPREEIIAYREAEPTVKSAIAIPIGGEYGDPLGAIYITSEHENAFSHVQDRRILRMLSRMAGELIRSYQFRWQETDRLGAILSKPDIVDESFGAFPSENDFIRDLEGFLTQLKISHQQRKPRVITTPDESEKQGDKADFQSEVQVVSLIGIDVNHVASLALKFGDRAISNLCREIGLRIDGELSTTFQKYPDYRFYHIVLDRFYVLLKYVPYGQVMNKARLLKKSLDGPYLISLFQPMGKQPLDAGTLVELPVTVRLAVSCYNTKTLDELLERHQGESDVSILRVIMERSTEVQLKQGRAAGGNTIKAWNPKTRLYETVDF